MKRYLLLALCFVVLSPMGFAVDREVIQLQQNVALLQGMLRELQRSFDEKMAVTQTLMGQSNDRANQVTQSIGQVQGSFGELQRTVQAASANTGQKVDALTSQMQGVQSTLDDLRARIDKISEQVTKLASASQNIPSQGTATTPGGYPPGWTPPSGTPGQDPSAAAVPSQPTADVLYNSALRDYTSGNYPLGFQEFTDYLHYYPGTTLAANAQFYLGDIYYQQGQFQKAIVEYDKTIEQYPNGNKSAAAQLKKAYALLNMDMRAQGVRELNSLMRRFPNTPESALAKDKLASLGPARPGAKASARP